MGNQASLSSSSSSKPTPQGDSKPQKKVVKPTSKLNTSSGSPIETLHSHLTVRDHSGDTTRDVFEYYEKVKVIGEGSTCKIYAVRRKQGDGVVEAKNDTDDGNHNTEQQQQQQFLALKEISKDQVDGVFLEELRNEVAIMRTLDHPNIVRVYEMFESKRAIFLIMEYCYGGDLYSRVPFTNEYSVAKIMTKLLSAVAYLHKNKIIHRDIKMENIMLESDKPDAEVKLIDFGLSQSYVIQSAPLSDIVGTAYSMSPQVIRKQYTAKADLWACGVVAFILLSNKWPFDGTTNKEITTKIMKYDWNKDFEGEEWKGISSEAKSFVTHLLAFEEDKRWDAPQALRSKWLNKTFPLGERAPEINIMNSVTNALIHSANDGKMKKLAMQVIAYNSSTADIEKLRAAFDQFDTNNNGTINYWEFRTSLNQCKYKDADIKKIFKKLDVNNTGVINYTEFISATLETLGKIEDERIRTAFDKLDVDNTGHISKNNLCSVLGDKCTAKDCDNLVNDLMEEVDVDGDGTISYDEFLALFRERHREANENACCAPKKKTEKLTSSSGEATKCCAKQ